MAGIVKRESGTPEIIPPKSRGALRTLVGDAFSTWMEKVGIVLTILPFIENIPAVKIWLHGKPFIEDHLWFLWLAGGLCVVWGFYEAYRKKFNELDSVNHLLADGRNKEEVRTGLSNLMLEGNDLAKLCFQSTQPPVDRALKWEEKIKVYLENNLEPSFHARFVIPIPEQPIPMAQLPFSQGEYLSRLINKRVEVLRGFIEELN